ncbi:MAG: D-Ala-D-Ala carboxypeptidase family metallohydrolase [Hyphomicrobiaceae bacterium]|nr:D-Ala-D-Ala carboxypeptidase family metallohydrolase [Hyphomicrobiaceae bacterium]
MSNLLSGRFRVAVGTIVTALAFTLAPAGVEAKRCGVLSNTFDCMTGVKKKTVQKKIRVAAIRPTGTITDSDPGIIVRSPVRKGQSKLGKAKKKASTSRRRKSSRRLKKSKNRSVRRRKGLRTIGSRYKARSVRKLSRGSKRLSKASRKKRRSKASRKQANSGKRGWRTRSKGLGFRTAHKGISTSCFPARLKKMLRKVSAHYGRKLVITSGFRSHRHNRRIGGARRSQHVHCKAADFYIPGVNKYSLARFLKRLPGRGGVGTYSGNRTVHLDVGPRRSWHWGSKRRHARKGRSRKHRVRKARSKRYSSRRRNARKRASRRNWAKRFRGAQS